jgi:hypothetical protein
MATINTKTNWLTVGQWIFSVIILLGFVSSQCFFTHLVTVPSFSEGMEYFGQTSGLDVLGLFIISGTLLTALFFFIACYYFTVRIIIAIFVFGLEV